MLSRLLSRTEALVVVRYLLVGLLAVAIQMAVLFVSITVLGLTDWYLACAVIGFVIALITAFLLQKYWTFKDMRSEDRARQFVSYTTVACAGLILNLGLLSAGHALVDSLGLDFFAGWYALVQLCALGICAVASFLANRFVTFRTVAPKS